MQKVQITIGAVVCIGIGLFTFNAVRYGTDIPAGVLNLFSIVIGALFAPNAIDAALRRRRAKKEKYEAAIKETQTETVIDQEVEA